jgi:hypothetical protein
MALVYDKAFFDRWYGYDVEVWGIEGGGRNSVRVRYHAHHIRPYLNGLYTGMRSNLPGFAQVSNVAIVGGAFGWAGDYLNALGVNVVTVDTSPYVQATKLTTEEAELRAVIAERGLDPNTATMLGPQGERLNILAYLMGNQASVGRRTTQTVLNESMNTQNSRRNVQRALPATMDAIVTEDTLSSFTDAELPGFLANVNALRPNPACTVVHLITVVPEGLDPAGYGVGTPFNWKTKAQWRALLDSLGYGPGNHRLYAPNDFNPIG